MVEETPGVLAGIFTILASFLSLFSGSPEPIAAASLPIYLAASTETLGFDDPIDLQAVPSEHGAPGVLARLSAGDAARLADFTARHIGESVGFVVCGQELMAPIVRERIAGGQFLISSADQNETLLSFLRNGCP